MRLLFSLVIILLFESSPGAVASVQLDALSDELKRSQKELRIGDYPSPYFIAYTLIEVDEATLSSCFGSTPVMNHTRYRALIPSVRVGDYNLDSSWPLISNKIYSATATTDDDYSALRRCVWLATDGAYKAAVSVAEWKKAYLSAHEVPNRLPDFTRESPTVAINQTEPLSLHEETWSKLTKDIATEFQHYPALQKGKVMFKARRVNRWFVNSEGTQIQDSRPMFGIIMNVSAQAKDGMTISDCECVAGDNVEKLPSLEELKALANGLAKRVTEVQAAPQAEEYCGPVLFQGQAAAEFFSQVMAPNLGFAADYIGHEDFRNPLKNAIGRKVLSSGITVEDDPLLSSFNGKPVIGGYRFDDDGVPAQKLTLVKEGILKDFCRSRLPDKAGDHSNGHALGDHGVASVLRISTSKPATNEEIRQKLSSLAQDAGLDYVLVIERLGDEVHFNAYPEAGSAYAPRSYATPSYSVQPSNPVVCYKLYLKDGRRELVRGLEFRFVSLRAFRDIQAVGANEQAYIVEPIDGVVRDLITPEYVVGELELTPIKAEHRSAPLMPSPIAEQAASMVAH